MLLGFETTLIFDPSKSYSAVGFSIINYRKERKMLFTLSPHYRAFERMMTGIPNFRPRGHGIYITRDSPQKPPRERAGCILEAMTPMMQERRSMPFTARLGKHITETEKLMNYRNKNHEAVFKETAAKLIDDNDLLAAVYLLTADRRLWWDAEGFIRNCEIRFDKLRHRKSSNSAYVLLCAAKDGKHENIGVSGS